MQIQDGELSVLLERLAATETTFATPVTTIRDVSEATDASPKLIARILGEMRGPSDIEHINERLDAYERRLKAVETRPQISSIKKTTYKVQERTTEADPHWATYKKWLDEQGGQSPFKVETNERIGMFVVGTIVVIFFVSILIAFLVPR